MLASLVPLAKVQLTPLTPLAQLAPLASSAEGSERRLVGREPVDGFVDSARGVQHRALHVGRARNVDVDVEFFCANGDGVQRIGVRRSGRGLYQRQAFKGIHHYEDPRRI